MKARRCNSEECPRSTGVLERLPSWSVPWFIPDGILSSSRRVAVLNSAASILPCGVKNRRFCSLCPCVSAVSPHTNPVLWNPPWRAAFIPSRADPSDSLKFPHPLGFTLSLRLVSIHIFKSPVPFEGGWCYSIGFRVSSNPSCSLWTYPSERSSPHDH